MTRRARLARLAWLLVAALVPACSKDSSKGPEPAPVPDPFLAVSSAASSASSAPPASALASTATSAGAAPSGPAVPSPRTAVKLLDPGREPRRALRYAWHLDRHELMAIELRTSISVEGAGSRATTPLAPLEITIAIDPQSVSSAGELRFAWRVASADVGAGALDASTPPEMMQGWAAQLAPVAHLAGTAIVSSRGLSRGLTLDPASAGDAGLDQEMVAQVLQMVRDAAAPLPEEPVGTGARWQKATTLDARNAHALQNDTYTLVDLQDDRGQLADVFAQTATPQTAKAPPGASQGTPPQMDQMLSSGDEKVQFDLGRVVAQTALDGTTSLALSAPESRMSMVMRLGITVRGLAP